MGTDEIYRRIRFAYFLNGWKYENGNQSLLHATAERISPSEYSLEMDGNIFCPVCFTNLNRVPKEKEFFSNGRQAYFAHLRTYANIACDLRTKKPEGKRYDTYEEAKKAIDDELLVIVSGFVQAKPELTEVKDAIYNETPVEDLNGPISEASISRHHGESFKLPSKITTVQGICRNFDHNLLKYYFFPKCQYANRLSDLLHDIRDVSGEDDTPKLYYGIIIKSFNAGSTPRNIRMSKLQCNPCVKDFYFKAIDENAQEKGIHDNTKDRIIIMFGKVIANGIGLCIANLGWGEYSLLPEKYDSLLV